MGRFILRLPGNIYDSLFISTWKLTEYISAIFSLISTDGHIIVNRDGTHDAKNYYYFDSMMAEINESESVYCTLQDSVDYRITGE